jgi:hypothetical protein
MDEIFSWRAVVEVAEIDPQTLIVQRNPGALNGINFAD